jgi:hypothetical protein
MWMEEVGASMSLSIGSLWITACRLYATPTAAKI